MILMWVFKKNKQKNAIRRVLKKYGVPEQTIRYWIAVSAFETRFMNKFWNSPVFKLSNNLFNLIVPGSNRLNVGEGQTIFANIDDSVEALYSKVIKPFKYSLSYPSLSALVSDMKSKGFYTGNESDYQNGAAQVYSKLF